MEQNMVIGIEGLVGAGKTSICRELLDRIPNSIIMHGGNLYRAIVYALLRDGINLEDFAKNKNGFNIKKIMEDYQIRLQIEERESVFYIGDEKIKEEDLQSKEVSMGVSQISNVANNKELLAYGGELIESLKKEHSVIFSSRAIMQTYPKVDYHFFIVADLEERIRRKGIQYKGKMSMAELEQHIVKRDKLQEKSGFYDLSERTITLDVTKCQSAKESADLLMEYVKIPLTIA